MFTSLTSGEEYVTHTHTHRHNGSGEKINFTFYTSDNQPERTMKGKEITRYDDGITSCMYHAYRRRKK